MHKIILAVGLLISTTCFSQINLADSTARGWMFHISASYLAKGGDFSEYMKPGFGLGGDVQYKWRSNWVLSVGGQYHFADNLKTGTTIFDNLLTSQGELIGLNGEYSVTTFRERGWHATVDLGYIISDWGHNANSGVLISLGGGYNAHWIDVRNQQENTPQIQDDYLRGYDRYTQGFLTRQLIGYQFAGSNKRVNFTLAFECMQGFNKNVREYNYDTRAYDLDGKLDLYYGVRFSWFLPIYQKNPQKYYYY